MAITNAHIKPNPNSAPAFVDCTKWETPIAVPANSNPGPSLFNILKFNLDLNLHFFFTIALFELLRRLTTETAIITTLI